jgi:hypothetical protein
MKLTALCLFLIVRAMEEYSAGVAFAAQQWWRLPPRILKIQSGDGWLHPVRSSRASQIILNIFNYIYYYRNFRLSRSVSNFSGGM